VRGTSGLDLLKKVYKFVDKIQNSLYNMNHSSRVHDGGFSVSSVLLSALMES